MLTNTLDAALTWDDELLAFLPNAQLGVRRKVRLDDRSEGFGLLEPDAEGWTLCIPHGADAEVRVGSEPIDLGRLAPEPSGERRLRVCAGLSARVRMGEFRFEVRPVDA